jgi:hypothetical protein
VHCAVHWIAKRKIIMSTKPEPGSQVCSNEALVASRSLVSYYQEQLQANERQHADLTRKLDALFSASDYLHRVQWNTSTLTASENELREALANVNEEMKQVCDGSKVKRVCSLCV